MGTYLNPGDGLFKIALNSQIFVDKSRLLEVTNRCVGTMQRSEEHTSELQSQLRARMPSSA